MPELENEQGDVGQGHYGHILTTQAGLPTNDHPLERLSPWVGPEVVDLVWVPQGGDVVVPMDAWHGQMCCERGVGNHRHTARLADGVGRLI